MKPLIVAIALLSATLVAQSAPSSDISSGSSPANGPSYSQRYCAGFVTHAALPRTNFILGSKESPQETSFSGRSVLMLAGPGLLEGERYSILRQIDDPNRETSTPEQRGKLAKLGGLYEDIGWVTVHSVMKGATIASFDFSCDAAQRGDIIVPFKERPALAVRTVDGPVDSFRERSNEPKGRILGGRDFVDLVGTGLVVYTDFGSAKGAKPGDYLFVLRGYTPADLNKIDRPTTKLPNGAEADASAVNPARAKPGADSRLPLRVLGEMLVLSATSDSSTAIITRSFAEMQLGDVVVSEEVRQDQQPASAEAATATGDNASPCSRLRSLLHPHACRDSQAPPPPAQ
jgi:hypothetical protein